jgi:hypothetical protein
MQNETLNLTHRSTRLVRSLEPLNGHSVQDNPRVCPKLMSVVLSDRSNGGVVGPPILHLSLVFRTVLRDSTWVVDLPPNGSPFASESGSEKIDVHLDAIRGDPELLQRVEVDIPILSDSLVHCDEFAVNARRNFDNQRRRSNYDIKRSFAAVDITTNKLATDVEDGSLRHHSMRPHTRDGEKPTNVRGRVNAQHRTICRRESPSITPPQRRRTWRDSSARPDDHGSPWEATGLIGSEMPEDAMQVKHHWVAKEFEAQRWERVIGSWRAWPGSARVSVPAPCRPRLGPGATSRWPHRR